MPCATSRSSTITSSLPLLIRCWSTFEYGKTNALKEIGAQNTIFRSTCRGIWVAILHDEEGKPKIGRISQTIRDRFGDAVNDLIQPKKPKAR